jgi:zinc protease
MYSKRITEKTFSWGGKALATAFPAFGSVSVVGSVAAGAYNIGHDELATVHALMLLEGTKTHNKKDIQILLDSMGASLSFYVTGQRLGFAARAQAKYVPQMLALVAEVLSEPTFPQEELDFLKKREEANLTLAAQNTRGVANTLLARALFKKNHPNYSETVQEDRAVLETITSESLSRMHAATISVQTLVVSLAGDIEPTKAFALVDAFKKMPKVLFTTKKFTTAATTTHARAAENIKNKASIDYFIGLATRIAKKHSDYAALMLGVQILGNAGGFSGRLMKTVREEEGLTYGVYATLQGFAGGADGYMSVWGTFAPQMFARGRKSIMREIKKIVDEGVTEQEVQKHRDMYEARFRVGLSTSGAFARIAHDTAVEGLPMSYLDEFPQTVVRLTEKQVNKALKKYLKPENMAEAAAGPVEQKAFDK